MGYGKRENKKILRFYFTQFSTIPPRARLYYFYNKRKRTTKYNQLYLSVFLELKEIKKLNCR